MVLAITGMLTGLGFVLAGRVWQRTRTSRAITHMAILADLLEDLHLKQGAYPEKLSDLTDLLPRQITTNHTGHPLDPWKNEYIYMTNTMRTYTLYSYGGHDTNEVVNRLYYGH